MKIVKVEAIKLKTLEKSPVLKERSPISVPVILINSKNEVLFGENSISQNLDADGFVECIQLDTEDNIESRKICFAMHYLGISCQVGYHNFNTIGNIHPDLDYLFLWDTKQFEDARYREAMLKGIETEQTLF